MPHTPWGFWTAALLIALVLWLFYPQIHDWSTRDRQAIALLCTGGTEWTQYGDDKPRAESGTSLTMTFHKDRNAIEVNADGYGSVTEHAQVTEDHIFFAHGNEDTDKPPSKDNSDKSPGKDDTNKPMITVQAAGDINRLTGDAHIEVTIEGKETGKGKDKLQKWWDGLNCRPRSHRF